MGKPVLANAKCDVLQGQCLRSNAGLFYANYQEFAETLRAIDTTPSLQAALGRNGRTFFERNYAWDVIERKYVDMLHHLAKESPARTMEPLPGWFGRRRRSLPPADGVVKQLPAGPYKQPPTHTHKPEAGSQRSALGSQRPAAGSQPPPAPSHRPSPEARRDPRDQRRDYRGPRPDQRRPEGQRSQGQRPEGQRPQGQAKGDEGRRDPRRGRQHRRGRRPGGGGGR
jgi:hypothetical protein